MGPGMAAAGPVAGAAFGLSLLPGLTGGSDDGEIAARVEEVIAGDGRIGNSAIAVAVTDGVVELSGEVGSERERQSVEESIARVQGVREVSNRLTVAGAA